MHSQQSQVTARDWASVIGSEKKAPYFQEILQHIHEERNRGKTIYPPQSDLFNAFRYTPFSAVKVVILGQDPYHGPQQAHGLCFSVCPGVPFPPSLDNIFKELYADLGIKRPSSGCLIPWASQGVLLLNTVLSVEAGKAHSHANIGWERFTDAVIAAINRHHEGVVFLLWGAHAQKKGQHVDAFKHHLLKSVHPSPLSAHRGFLGCRHFSKTNQFLIEQGKSPIDWCFSVGD